MYHNFLMHFSVGGHLGRFHVLAIVSSVAINIVVCVCLFPLWFLQGILTVVGLLDLMVVLFLVEFPYYSPLKLYQFAFL